MKAFIGLLVLCGTYCSTHCAYLRQEPASACSNQEDGVLLPIPGECTGFYICLNGNDVISNCGMGAHFDPVTRTCIEEAKSRCVLGQYSEPVQMLAGVSCVDHHDGELLTIPGECSKFYICISEEGVLLDCGVGLHFDRKTQTCVRAADSACVQGEIVEQSKQQPKPEPQPQVVLKPKPHAKPERKPLTKPESIQESKPEKQETKAEKQSSTKNICLGKAIGAFIPSKASCNEFYVCVGSKAMLKKCKVGLHFSSETNSCIDAEMSSCLIKSTEEVKEKPKKTHQLAPIVTTIYAETICLGQANGAMFPVPGSCSKYFACLQQKAFEQTCGVRHFDSSVRTCIEAQTSKCVEGQAADNLEVVVSAAESGNEIGDTDLGTGNSGIAIGNANIQIDNTGIISDVNLVSGSSNLIVGNTDLGYSNSYYVSNNASGNGQNRTADRNAIQSHNASVGNTNLGRNNTGVFVSNANLSINNTGTISNANIVTASKDVQVGNTDLGSSNTYVISGGKVIGNNKEILIKHTGLPVNKKHISHIDKVDVAVDSSGISVDVDGVAEVANNDIGKESKLVINNGAVSTGDIKTDSNSNVVVGSGSTGHKHELEQPNEKDNREIVFAVVDEEYAEACVGIESGSLLPKIGSCSEFITCEAGVAFVGVCPRGLHFNAKGKFCDWPEYAGCALNW